MTFGMFFISLDLWKQNNIISIDCSCGCDECVAANEKDSLCHSQSRINAYKALSASSLIALSSRDPILTAFELSWELRRLSRMETEFRAEYNVRIIKFIMFYCLKFTCVHR